MFISIHIPKTAGTTLSIIFDYGCNRRIFYDYKNLRKLHTDIQLKSKSYKKDIKNIVKHKEFIVDNFEFIHGHFPYEKYAGIFPDEKFITCVRKPIDRLISHYHHVIEEQDHSYWLYNELISGNLDIVDMAKLDYIGNMQHEYLKGRKILDYDYIFINEKLAESIYYFQLLFSFERNDQYMNEEGAASVPFVNSKNRRNRIRKEISKESLHKAESLLIQDNEIYKLSLEKYALQASKAQSFK